MNGIKGGKLMRIARNTTVRAASLVLVTLIGVAMLWQNSLLPFQTSPNTNEIDAPSTASPDVFENKVKLADLEGIRTSGELRILVELRNNRLAITPLEKQFIEQYAQEEGLVPIWIGVEKPEQLYSYLQDGLGDVLAAEKLAVLTEKEDQISFTLPWTRSRQQLVGRAETGAVRSIQDLSGRQIALKPSSPVWQTLVALAEDDVGMSVFEIPENLDIRTVMGRVESGHYDLVILDSIEVESYLPSFLGLNVMFDFTEDELMVWGTRQDSAALHASLNQFLNKKHLELEIARVYRQDLPRLKERKLLRLITSQNPVNYYFDQGRLKGFEYELVKRFAKNHGMRLDVVIANSHEEMVQKLLAGQGDVIAASRPTNTYPNTEKLGYTLANNYAAPVLIGRSHDSQLLDARDLNNRRIVLPAESPYRQYMNQLIDQDINVEVVELGKEISTQAILYAVAQGIYDLTVIASHELKPQFARQLNLKAHFAMSEPLPHSWIVRDQDSKLLSALNGFIETEYRKVFYNVLYSKYIENPELGGNEVQLVAEVRRLSPYDEIVLKYAEDYGFDWRLIVAQMFQESQFDPKAVSYAGAEGLMQLLPTTAEYIGVTELHDPVDSIYGGVRYMDYLRERFAAQDIPLEDKTWFSLAAYNAGYSRLKRARLLAEEMNLDKNKWFDNVEKAMAVLSRPYKKDGRYVRYCRCMQTVDYVRSIRTRYKNYVRLTDAVTSNTIPQKQQQQI